MSRIFTTHYLDQNDEDLTCVVTYTAINNISLDITLSGFTAPNEVGYWKAVIEDLTLKIMERFEQNQDELIRFSVTGEGEFTSHAGDTTPASLRSRPRTLSFDGRTRSGQILLGFDEVFEPEHQEATGSGLRVLTLLETLNVKLVFPEHFNPQRLAVHHQFYAGCPLVKFAHIPFNKDKYCVLHSIYSALTFAKPHLPKTSLNADPEYMTGFTDWFLANQLERFYHENLFLLDRLGELEEQIETNLSVYSFDRELAEENTTTKGLTPVYRSLFNHQESVNLVIVPLSNFRKRGVVASPFTEPGHNHAVTTKKTINPEVDIFLAAFQRKRVINDVNAHACILNKNVFSKNNDAVCEYCDRNVKATRIEEHRVDCLNKLRCTPPVDREKVYVESKNPEKVFTKYRAFYRVPFVTYDFETRLVDGVHTPFSYALCYLNVFDVRESRVIMKDITEYPDLITNFIADCKALTEHHWNLQSVDHAPPHAEIPKPKVCPWCLTTPKNPMEFNHSHFRGDNLNLEHNRWVCHRCNCAVTLRNKPLRFLAHNAAKFDNNLIISQMLNDPSLKTPNFIAKTESKFSEVSFQFGPPEFNSSPWIKNFRYKMAFGDSLMLLAGSLASLANAWISPEDSRDLEALLEIFYGSRAVAKALAPIALGKAVFPYSALNNYQEHLDNQEPLAKEIFFDTLSGKPITEGDYQTYLVANRVLAEALGASYRFLDYHNFYLMLDVALLGLILSNFSKQGYTMAGINPLQYISASSFSFDAMLYANKYADVPPIVLPEVSIQKWLQRSIRGGYTQVLAKKANATPQNHLMYVDFNSLYPSVMIDNLPVEFDYEPPILESVAETLASLTEDRYYFLEVDIAPLAPQHQAKCSTYPMFPNNEVVEPGHLSLDQQRRLRLNARLGEETPLKPQVRNVSTFWGKAKYVTSLSYLKVAISVGYEVTRIHRILAFHQEPVMRDYVEKMYQQKRDLSIAKNTLAKVTDKAAIAVLETRIALTKLILNSLYGYTLVNSDLHSEIEVHTVDDENASLKKAISRSNFKSMLVVDRKVVLQKAKSKNTLEYPLMVGAAILWESKLLTARFVYGLYEYLQGFPGTKLVIHMFDTDSVIYSIENFFDHFKHQSEFSVRFNREVFPVFDTSFNLEGWQQPETHEALKFMKDETKGIPLTTFTGLCAKMYSITTEKETTTKGKGIPKAVAKEVLTSEVYRAVVDGTMFTDHRDFGLCARELKERYTAAFGGIRANHLFLENREFRKQYLSLVDLKAYYGENSPNPLIFGSVEHLAAIAEL